MQSRFIIAVFCCLITLNSIAQGTTGKLAVLVKNGRLTIGKTILSKDWTASSIIPVLGKKNDRRRAGYNTTHSFDGLGIVLFEKNDNQQLPTDTISEVQVYTGITDSNGVRPAHLFTGLLQIENLKLTGNETPQMIKAALKQYKVTDSYMEHNIRLAYNGLYIYFLFNNEEDKLLKISIGKDNRKY